MTTIPEPATDETIPANDTPRAWVEVARRKWAHYQQLDAGHEPGQEPSIALMLAERGCAGLVPHLVAAVDALYAEVRAANGRTIELGRQLAAQATTGTDPLAAALAAGFTPDALHDFAEVIGRRVGLDDSGGPYRRMERALRAAETASLARLTNGEQTAVGQ